MAKKAGTFTLGKAGARPMFPAAPNSQTVLNTSQRTYVASSGQLPTPPQRASESNSNPSLPSSSQPPSQYQAYPPQAYPQNQAFQNYAQYCSVCWTQAGSFCCSSCAQTAVLLCGNCISDHFATQGYHCIRKLEPAYDQAANPSGEYCSLCRYYPGTVICCCQLPAVVLCNQCIQSHIGMIPYAVHINLPIQAKTYVTSQKYIEKLRNRQMGKEQARQALRANLLKIGEAEQAVVKVCTDLINAIQKQQGEWLTELNSIKFYLTQRMEEAVKEAEDHIYEEKFESQNDLATAIWNYSLRPTTEFEVFHYRSRPDVLTNSLKKMFHLQYDIESLHFPCHLPYIPLLIRNQIKRFDYRDEEWLPPLTLPQTLQQPVWIVISDKELFVLAGNNSYLVEIETGNIKALTGFQVRGQQTHTNCGIAVYDDKVYLLVTIESILLNLN